MMAQTRIKIFSHNDLDGFGGPLLLETLHEVMFKDVEFEIENIGAGQIDVALGRWFRDPSLGQFTDVYIMDMTPDSDYTFQQLDANFANHWLVFDHHESEAAAREKYAINAVTPQNPAVTPSATSLVWDWLQTQPHFSQVSAERQAELAEVVELIRAYDTWDWQNDPQMSTGERQAADELNQLFWFYPLDHSAEFVSAVLATSWTKYRAANQLLITTLNDRRAHYLKSHLKDVLTAKIDGQTWGFVYASDYKSEIAHALLTEHPDVAAAMVISPTSLSLRSNGQVDVAKFAEDYFGGGGHADAAGARINVNMIKIGTQAVIEEVQKVIKRHQSQPAEATGSLADNLDPAVAAKMAALFGKSE